MAKPIHPDILRHIQDNAIERFSMKRRMTTNMYVLDEIQTHENVIRARHQEINITKPTAVVFVDDEPKDNWSHKCRYLLYNAETGQLYREVKAGFPHYLVHPPDNYKAFHTPVVVHNPMRKVWSLRKKILFPMRFRKGNRYAILFSGVSNNRHTNDLEFLYRHLLNQYYFDEENIRVLNYDGTVNYFGTPQPVGNWPGDNTPYTLVVNDAGTKKAFEDAIDALKTRLKPDDMLIIHTNSHGGHNGTDSYLCTYSGPDYTASDFANKISELPKFADLVVMMEQCHSGGFNDAVIESSPANRTTFAAACTEGKSSIGGPDFDPFTHDWISAIAGVDSHEGALVSDPDYDSSGKISTREAFSYADDLHHYYDSPVYSAYGIDAGDQHMHEKWHYLHVYREFIMEELRILYDTLDDIVKYRKVLKKKILPSFIELDDKWAVTPPKPDEAEKTIDKIIQSITQESGALEV